MVNDGNVAGDWFGIILSLVIRSLIRHFSFVVRHSRLVRRCDALRCGVMLFGNRRCGRIGIGEAKVIGRCDKNGLGDGGLANAKGVGNSHIEVGRGGIGFVDEEGMSDSSVER